MHGGSALCLCGKIKEYCVIHNGSFICPCGKSKTICLIHGGSALCSCGKVKQHCKKCSDPIKITISKMISHSKQKDIKYNRYDVNKFIDKCFIESLIKESTKCFYCKVQMQFIKYQNDLCTIERINNSIGHIKSNCILACLKCNNLRISQK
jgi:hypothetical protein